MAIPIQLALTLLDGTADLACPSFDAVVRNVAIQFDPVELVFTVQFLATDRLVQNLATEYEPIEFQLFNVVLSNAGLGIRLEAEVLKTFFRQNALSELPDTVDCAAYLRSNRTDLPAQRLVLRPHKREITFISPALVSEERPYQVFYNNACANVSVPGDLALDGRATPVHFRLDKPAKGFICAFADADFFPEEKRIHAALQLIHGRHLPVALKVQGRRITFYGHRAEKRLNYLPLVKDDRDASHLTDAVLAAFAVMPPDQFEKIRYALSFFLLGKHADVPVEAKYLLLMACVEAMDDRDSLRTDATSWVLGISSDAATLVNGMRHQLTHGQGGYQQAFDAVLSEQFKNTKPQLESAFKACITAQGKLDFYFFWRRVCERIDAFWCARLGISESLAKHRFSTLLLMDLPVLVPPLMSAPTVSRSSKARIQIKELLLENERLTQEINQLNLRSIACETEYADIKLQLQTFEQKVLDAKGREKSD